MLGNLLSTTLLVGITMCSLIVAIAVMRPLVQRLGGAQWTYALWLLLLIPFIVPLLPNAAWATLPYNTPLTFTMNSVADVVVGSIAPEWLSVLGACWALGIMFSATRLYVDTRRMRTAVLQDTTSLPVSQQRIITEICSRVGVFPAPQATITRRLQSPALLGVIAPTLVVPADFFDSFSRAEQNLMLRHELVHLKRHDMCWNLLFSFLRCCFWFIPLFAIAERRFRMDQERACDHAVIWDEPRLVRANYAMAMLKTVTSGVNSTHVVSFIDTKHDLLGRVAALDNHRKSLPQSLFGACTIVALVALTAFTMPRAEASLDSSTSSTRWCSVYSELGF